MSYRADVQVVVADFHCLDKKRKQMLPPRTKTSQLKHHKTNEKRGRPAQGQTDFRGHGT